MSVAHAQSEAPAALGASDARNLHLSPISRDWLEKVFRRSRPRAVLPPLGDARWHEAFARPYLANCRDELLRRARLEREQAPPELSDELYLDYAATGTRLRFERVYFARRRMLARAAMTLLAEGECASRATTRSFLCKLESIFAEESWALPAHVKNANGKDPRQLDLFATETANLVAECLAVFSSVIPVSLQARVRGRLRRDVFENYRDGDFFWMRATHNWNAVCHQGVLGAALTIEDDAGLLADMFVKARVHLRRFLEGFGGDGACSDGPSYWDYGFGWFAALNAQLETRTEGALSLFRGDDKIRGIAGYGPSMSLECGKLINFSDCDPMWSLRPSTLQYLGETLEHEECLRLAWVNYEALAKGVADYEAERSDFFYWSRIFHLAPKSPPPVLAAAKQDIFYPSLGLWIVHGRDRSGHLWELAAKAGHNAEHHNHNDVGGFILVVDGVPLATEIGMPEYTANYFSAGRYDHLAARTLGHSLPLINGHEQAPGGEFAGTVLCAETDGPVVSFEADLTNAYPAAAGCRQFVRQLTLDKSAGRCFWRDEIRLEQPGAVVSGFITDATDIVIESSATAVIRKDGLVLELSCEGDGIWTGVETHNYFAHDGSPASCRRLALTSAKGTPTKESTNTVRLSIRDR